MVGSYTLEGQDEKNMDFTCLTIINPAAGWFKMVELPVISQLTEKDGKKYIKWTIDTSSAEVARLFNQQWLSCYARATYLTHDNGSEFKLHFESLCDSFGITSKTVTVKDLQVR